MASLSETSMTLQLDYWADELSPAQKAAYEKAEKEHNEIRNKLMDLVQETGGKNIFSGEVFTAYQVLGPVPGLEKISQPVTSLAKKKPVPSQPPPLILASSSRVVVSSIPPESPVTPRRKGRRVDEPAETVLDLAADDDDEDYIPLSKRMKQKDKDKDKPTTSLAGARKSSTPEVKARSAATTIVRPTEFGAIGGLQVGLEKDKKKATAEPSAVVDLTKDDAAKPTPDSREISFSKIQGKTFPSLVVIARPSLRVPEKVPNDRSQLDTKVKNVLVHPATKFTEWLIQQGLIKSDQFCKIHTDKPLKLGMYSDVNKFPYSGGYFWISDCCPQRFTSVFNGSLFEGSPHPPTVILKLIYHWVCQTNVSNVVNWVKGVDNVYLKGLYTLLRSVCTLALCTHMKLFGGAGKSVEIGVISLGTTTQDGQQRQVKVEVLGVLDQASKLLRLRAVEPLTDGDKSYKKRFAKILEPLSDWVHKDSTILTDLTVDKGTLNSMGFKSVQQVSPAEASGKNSNANIMDYLRRIVPRMFQNTLSLLSRQIIQQFLNELVWREMYGTSPLITFDNIVKHLSEQAKIESPDSLITLLNKVAADPFKHWDVVPDPPKAPAKRGRKPKDRSAEDLTPAAPPVASTSKAVPTSVPPTDRPKKSTLKKMQKAAPNSNTPPPPPLSEAPPRKSTGQRKLGKEATVVLESYYYGSAGGSRLKESALPCTGFKVECPECPGSTFRRNVDLLDHLLRHAQVSPANDDGSMLQCRYCLQYVSGKGELQKHRALQHPLESKNPFRKTCNCIICGLSLSTVAVLSEHLQKRHHPLEMPYHCAGCDYRSSSISNTVDHFYQQHKKSSLLQCPFCLKMACVFRNTASAKGSAPEQLTNNVRMFLLHLRKHTVKGYTQQCNKCMLSFLSKGSFRFHSIFAHKPNFCEANPITTSETVITKPSKKAAVYRESSFYRVIKPFNKLVLNMSNGHICLECRNDFDEFNHIIGLVQCIKCPYQTTCLPSMVNHSVKCTQGSSASVVHPTYELSQEMFCHCGFSSDDGYALARHLIVCSTSAGVFTSDDAAQANVGKRSMLDMLGLVRRDDDEQCDTENYLQGNKQPPESRHTVVSLRIDTLKGNERKRTAPLVEASGCESGANCVPYDPTQSLYNIAGTGGGEQQFNIQLSLDDLGPPSVLPAQDTDRTPQLKDDYQSLATPRVPEHTDY